MAELMECDPELLAIATERAKLMDGKWFYMMTPEEAREMHHRMADHSGIEMSPEAAAVRAEDNVFDFDGHQIKVRVYKPVQYDRAPVIMYFHGGGWVFGDIATYDESTRWICAETGCVVVSVEYLLAPENKFPLPVLSAAASVDWALAHIDELGGYADSVLVMGDSAGGNISAGTAVVCTNRGVKLAGQVLLYGLMVHMSRAEEVGVSAWATKDQRFGVAIESANWYWGHYLGDPEDANDPRASPLLAEDMSQLPPAIIASGMLDTLCDEGEVYGRAMAKQGVPVQTFSYPHLTHGFMSHGWLPKGPHRSEAAHAAAVEVVTAVRELAWSKHPQS
jgi:acetyl esterase